MRGTMETGLLTHSSAHSGVGATASRRCGGRPRSFRSAHRAVRVTTAQITVQPDISLTALQKGPMIGKGSFGNVYQGLFRREDGVEEQVVIKEFQEVRGRDVESFYRDELQACRRLVDNEGVADFLGVAGADVYLVWRYEGSVTLESVLASGDGLAGVGEVMGTDSPLRLRRGVLACASGHHRQEALGLFSANLLNALMNMHAAGVVHRDVKPNNILFAQSEEGVTVKMIDLGGVADLNRADLDVEEAIFDPVYGAPEQFIVTPGLMGPKLEASGEAPTYGFDSFSAGLVILQLAVPTLASRGAMQKMRNQLHKRSELGAWAESKDAQIHDLSFLEAFPEAWDFIVALTQADPESRLGIYEAFSHPFLASYVGGCEVTAKGEMAENCKVEQKKGKGGWLQFNKGFFQ